MYIDPAAWPSELKEALKVQSAQFSVNEDQAFAVARLAESLRMEAEQEISGDTDKWDRVVGITPDTGPICLEKVADIGRDIVTFVMEMCRDVFNGNIKEDSEEFLSIKEAIASYCRTQCAVRIIYAMLRSMEVNAERVVRLNPDIFSKATVGPEGEALVPDNVSENDWKVWRIAWIISAIRDSNYRGLVQEEKDYLENVARMDEDDEVSDQTLATMEYFLMRSQPNHQLFATMPGRKELQRHLRAEARKDAKWLLERKDLDKDVYDLAIRVVSSDDESLTHKICAVVAEARALIINPGAVSDIQ